MNGAQASKLAAHGRNGPSCGRRSVPTARVRLVHRPVSQRWCERPRCLGPRVAPALGDGVVHTIAGYAAVPVCAAGFARKKGAARVPVWRSARSGQATRDIWAHCPCVCRCLEGVAGRETRRVSRHGCARLRGPDCPDNCGHMLAGNTDHRTRLFGVTFHVLRHSHLSGACRVLCPTPSRTKATMNATLTIRRPSRDQCSICARRRASLYASLRPRSRAAFGA